jgi:hypothetical protein
MRWKSQCLNRRKIPIDLKDVVSADIIEPFQAALVGY